MLLARVSVALTIGVGLLRDVQVLRDIWLLPLRDLCGLGFLGVELCFGHGGLRGERFRLWAGRISPVG